MATKMKDANTINELCKKRYDRAYQSYAEANDRCVIDMKRLDEKKLEVWNSFEQFLDVFEKIKNRPELTGSISEEQIRFTRVDLEDLKCQVDRIRNATVVLSGAVAGAAAGTVGATTILGGIGLSAFVACGVAEGVAVTASMAEVTLALYGASAVFWPAAIIASAAVATGSLFGYARGNKKLAAAKETEEQTDIACRSFQKASAYLDQLDGLTVNTLKTLGNIFTFYIGKLAELERVVDEKEDYTAFTEKEKRLLEAVTILVAILKKIVQTPLLKQRTDAEKTIHSDKVEGDTQQAEADVPDEINDAELNAVVVQGSRELERLHRSLEENTASLDRKNVAREIIDVGTPNDLKENSYTGKTIRFHSRISCVKRTLLFHDCRILFVDSDSCAITLRETQIRFESCSLENQSGGKDVELLLGDGCKAEVIDSRFVREKKGRNISFTVKEHSKVKFVLTDSTISGMTVPFLFAENCFLTCKISNCVFEDFEGAAVKLCSCGDKPDTCVIENTSFLDFRPSIRTKEVSGETAGESAIWADYCAVSMKQCQFEMLKLMAVSGASLEESHCFLDCRFHDIWTDERYSGGDHREYSRFYTIHFNGGRNVLQDCSFEDTMSLYLGSIGAFGNVLTSIRKCRFVHCRGGFYLQGAELVDSVFLGCTNYGEKQKKVDTNDLFARVFAKLSENVTHSIIHIQGMAGNRQNSSLSEVSGCSFIDCEGENYIIEPSNTMDRRAVSVSINTCLFRGCMTKNGEMFTTDQQKIDGSVLRDIATVSGNRILNANCCNGKEHLPMKEYDIAAILSILQSERN